jgi:hypothetical protein
MLEIEFQANVESLARIRMQSICTALNLKAQHLSHECARYPEAFEQLLLLSTSQVSSKTWPCHAFSNVSA